VLDVWLRDLPAAWTRVTEGPDTWSPFDVVGHLIHGELTDWIPRARIILEHGSDRPFDPFDRFAQLDDSRGKTMPELLDRLAELRAANLLELDAMKLTPEKLRLEGIHPEFGNVTLGQHLATWVVHDLDHLAQIARVMASRHRDAVGPWRAYLRILGNATG
jgi:hypothetical protein